VSWYQEITFTPNLCWYYYPHIPIGKVWIYSLLFVCSFVILCVGTVTDFSARNKASGVKFCMVGRESPICWKTLLPQKPKIGRICERTGHAHRDVNTSIDMCRRKIHARDAPFVEYHAACGRRIGMCGYTVVLEDGRTCSHLSLISSIYSGP